MATDARILPFRPTGEPLPAAIRAEGIRITRAGRRLLDLATLSLGETGVTALLGPNGAGKSILLRVIMGLVTPDEGKVWLDPALGLPAFVPQNPVLLRRTVRGNLRHALALAGVPRRDRTGRMAELLVMAGLAPHAETRARALSGGERQRLAIARALAATPRLLLLDEPTASLDPAATAAVETLIGQIAAQGVKVVMVTHDRAQAARVCSDVAFLNHGRITEHSPASRFFDNPASPEARAYLAGQLLL